MKVFVIGAAGGVGRRLSQLMSARGDEVTGMHRGPAQADILRDVGAAPLVGDSVDALAEKISGHDAVVFSAGAHGTGMNKTTLIDGQGLEKAADAATRAGVSRFVLSLLSSTPFAPPRNKGPWREPVRRKSRLRRTLLPSPADPHDHRRNPPSHAPTVASGTPQELLGAVASTRSGSRSSQTRVCDGGLPATARNPPLVSSSTSCSGQEHPERSSAHRELRRCRRTVPAEVAYLGSCTGTMVGWLVPSVDGSVSSSNPHAVTVAFAGIS
jgi:hypothetical protein